MTQANPSASTQAAAARAALADSPLIVTVAPNGAYKQAADHPAVPLTAAALAQEARACLDAGAAMMHMHVRDAQGRHSLDAQAYRDALAAVKQAVGDSLLVQVTISISFAEPAVMSVANPQGAAKECAEPHKPLVVVGLAEPGRDFDVPSLGNALHFLARADWVTDIFEGMGAKREIKEFVWKRPGLLTDVVNNELC